jgi:signal peptidase II
MKDREGVGLGRQFLFWSIAVGGTAFDLTTKWYVFSRYGPPAARRATIVPDILELHTSQNTGALWGLGSSIPHGSWIFAGLSVVAAVVIVYYLFVLGAASSRLLTIALGLIMAGAMGNCYDRLMFGYVRDFVHFHVDAIGFDCAIFNFADNMLVAGAITIVLYAMRPERSPNGEPADTSSWFGYLFGNNALPEKSPLDTESGPVDAQSVDETMRRTALETPRP